MEARDLAHPEEAAFDETGVKRQLGGWSARAVAAIALAFSAYQLVIAAYAPLSSLPTRSIHVGFLLALAFLIHPVAGWADRMRIAWYDVALALRQVARPGGQRADSRAVISSGGHGLARR